MIVAGTPIPAALCATARRRECSPLASRILWRALRVQFLRVAADQPESDGLFRLTIRRVSQELPSNVIGSVLYVFLTSVAALFPDVATWEEGEPGGDRAELESWTRLVSEELQAIGYQAERADKLAADFADEWAMPGTPDKEEAAIAAHDIARAIPLSDILWTPQGKVEP